MKIGIVGLPNVGKSTLFNALTKAGALAANYPFATIEPNVGIVPVPDDRLEVLAGLYGSKKLLPASVTFVDIAGLVKGASEGQGLDNQFLANIRECNAIVQVVRAFEDDNVIHVDGTADSARDIETINTELILADLQTIDKRIAKLAGEVKRGSKEAVATMKAVEAARKVLDDGGILYGSAVDLEALADMQLLTAKPFVYVFNVDEGGLGDAELRERLAATVAPAPSLVVCAQIEAELAELPAVDAAELLAELGVARSGLDDLVAIGNNLLGLQTYLTAGPQEVRAWTIPIGATAPQAAGVIHTDFEKGFIKAEIVGYDDLVAAGSLVAARAAGKARLEGKDYIMRDGDVVEFRFNV